MTFRQRMEYVAQQCGYETQAEFAAAIGLKSPQALNNWYARSNYGRGGKRLKEATGVSLDWLAGEDVEAFPKGPIKRRLTKDGSSDPAGRELGDLRLPNDIKALQWIAGALVGHLLASQPDAAGELIESLEALPAAYKATGPGAALLSQLEKAKGAVESARAHKASKPHGTAQAGRRNRP